MAAHCHHRLVVLLIAACAVLSSSFQLKQTNINIAIRGTHATSTTTSNRVSSTKLQSVVASTIVTALDTVWKTQPYTVAALVCGFKASAADIVAQKRQLKMIDADNAELLQLQTQTDVDNAELLQLQTQTGTKATATMTTTATATAIATTATATVTATPIDLQRNLSFILYGSIYQGAAQEFIYNHLYPVWFGSGNTISIALTKVCFDLLVQTTTITLPIAYLTKALIYQYSFEEALRRYGDDISNHGLLKKYFLLWGPVNILTFTVVPEHLRLTWIALVSFFWLIILSSISSKAEECVLEDAQTCTNEL
jgi:hypothetical protein